MKATATRKTTPPPFEPVEVTITLESQRELDAFGKLFNYSPINDTLKELCGTDPRLWELLSNIGADTFVHELSRILKKHMA